MFNITNYSEHPTRPGYYVFRFYQKDRSDFFEELLNKEGVWYEFFVDEEEKITYLYGIKLKDYKKAVQANYMVSARFRNKTVSNPYARWVIYAVTIGVLVLMVISMLKSKP
ncbi:MAG: hypothetical protein KDD41_07075 [Flavobacteriales bacterium]|nr:hypothetical protein [Flavobacteriales bacterium]